jgi:branched-chain amino acid transport system permease protein
VSDDGPSNGDGSDQDLSNGDVGNDDPSTGDEPADSRESGSAGAAAGGGARSASEAADAGGSPIQAVREATGIRGRRRALLNSLTPAERNVLAALSAFLLLLLLATAAGVIRPAYLLYLLSLAGMYLLLSMGLNVQWGYTGLINFSVAAFFGLGAYGAALMTSSDAPVLGNFPPILGLFVGLALAGFVAVLIGIPTLNLREDYLAIASLGLAEVVRLFVNNEGQWTGGAVGLSGIPRFFDGWPVLGDLARGTPTAAANLVLVIVFVAVTYLFLRRIHRSPWGRVQRTIRADEDLATALGKDTYRFKMESFVIGSMVMALAGVFFAHLQLYLDPGVMSPTQTFYVWIAVILGGTGSNRGAMFGGFVIVAIQQGTRFVGSGLPVDTGPLRLLLVGLIIILVIRYRPEGLLPPQRELVWPDATDGGPTSE